MSKNYILEKDNEDLNFNLKFHLTAENYLAATNDLLLGADINHVAHHNGRSILHIAAIAHKPTIEMVKFLVENGASNLHHKDNFGKSPLYYLLIANHFDVAEFMIRELKAEIHRKDFADKPREVFTSNKSTNFQKIINWCENLSSKLKDEQMEAAKIASVNMSNELSNEDSIGTYLGRLPEELIDFVCNVVSKNNPTHSTFYHNDNSTIYTPEADFNNNHNNDTGNGAGIFFITYTRIPVSGATNDNNSVVYEDISLDMNIGF